MQIIEQINNLPVKQLADFYAVSIPTVNRWRADNKKIPDYVHKMKDLYDQVDLLKSDKMMLQIKIKNMGLSIDDYFDSLEKLRSYI